MMRDRDFTAVERPRTEPEIIPPGDRRTPRQAAFSAVHHVYIGRIGPFGLGLLALACLLTAAVVLLLLLGAFLIWIPLAGLLLAAAVISSLFPSSRRRL